MKNEKIRTVNKSITSLLKNVKAGKFAIPRLQREFVWDGPRAAKLLDSIFKGMPIGALLVWETPKANKLYLRERYHVLPPFNYQSPEVWFIIDGQQRVSVLHCINNGSTIENAKRKTINFEHIVFSLAGGNNEQRFFYRKPSPGRFVSLTQILDPSWRELLSGLKKKQLNAVKICRENILKYKIIMVFTYMRIDEVKECFLRINTQGMKVTTADAIFTRAETVDFRDFVHEVKRDLSEGHKNIEDMPILWAFAALKGEPYPGGHSIEHTIKKIEKEAVQNKSIKKKIGKEWMRLKKCFGKSVDYLMGNFNVISSEYLYSPYMISMLALFYYHNKGGPDQKQKKEVRKWFWATTVASRYSGKNFYKCLEADVEFFEKLAKNNNIRFKTSELAHAYDIRKTQYNSSSSGIGSAFYCLLFQREPVSLLDDGLNNIPITQFSTTSNRKNRHHIFPRGLMNRYNVTHAEYNSLCNICLLTAEENIQIGNSRPSVYLKEARKNKNLFAKKMQHHLISHEGDSGLWEKTIKKGFHRFVREREELLRKAIEKEAGIKLFRDDR